MRHINIHILSFLLVLLVSACVSSPKPQVWPWPDDPHIDGYSSQNQRVVVAEEGEAPSGSQRSASGSSALANPDALHASSAVAQQLVDEARELRRQGRFSEAYRQLERGVSIAPRDAVLWFELARVRLAEKRWGEAENLAQRSLEYSVQGDDVSAYCWELIARSREGRGDRDGAAQARQMGRVRS